MTLNKKVQIRNRMEMERHYFQFLPFLHPVILRLNYLILYWSGKTNQWKITPSMWFNLFQCRPVILCARKFTYTNKFTYKTKRIYHDIDSFLCDFWQLEGEIFLPRNLSRYFKYKVSFPWELFSEILGSTLWFWQTLYMDVEIAARNDKKKIN